jgi:hypothetical protein
MFPAKQELGVNKIRAVNRGNVSLVVRPSIFRPSPLLLFLLSPPFESNPVGSFRLRSFQSVGRPEKRST